MPAGRLTVALTAGRTGIHTLRFPRPIAAIDCDVADRISEPPLGNNCRRIRMQAGDAVEIAVRLQ